MFLPLHHLMTQIIAHIVHTLAETLARPAVRLVPVPVRRFRRRP